MSPPRSPSLPQVLAGAVEGALQEVHTQMPGRIESFDAQKCVADVQPAIDQMVLQEDGTVVATRYPVIRNVPVVFDGANGYRSTWPVAQGDYCLIIFQESSIDTWRSNGGIVDPGDGRRFHISDAICKVGLQPNGTPWTGIAIDAATWGKDGGPQVVARSSTLELGADAANPPTDWAALASLVKAEIQALRDTVDAGFSALSGHTHELTTVTGTTSNAIVGSPSTIVPGGLIGPTGAGPTLTGPAAVNDVKSVVVKVK